ncbi:MAG TPA: hypothetical protein VM716_02280 [Gemmatimonadales bacterium]|nr:hypothetical protein [Gemmatimonadales bacterium]
MIPTTRRRCAAAAAAAALVITAACSNDSVSPRTPHIEAWLPPPPTSVTLSGTGAINLTTPGQDITFDFAVTSQDGVVSGTFTATMPSTGDVLVTPPGSFTSFTNSSGPCASFDAIGQLTRPSDVPPTPITTTYHVTACDNDAALPGSGGDTFSFTVDQPQPFHSEGTVTGDIIKS